MALTDEQIAKLKADCGYAWPDTSSEYSAAFVEGVKEGYAAALTAQVEQTTQPVAWYTEDHLTDRSATTYDKNMMYRWQCKGWPVTPLYTSPPKAAPLTVSDVEQILARWSYELHGDRVRYIVRETEKAHGITPATVEKEGE